ncbi:cilia- and flagella-associated protein 144-like [Argopecten irradians]|uniref:cilia- and flagella-associated protein 144-like n=1 Tax=Argopecten irradians TaxID=31199 RepID=UPI00371DCA45
MAKAAVKGEKEPPNFVHHNAILCETIMKEQRHQVLYTNFSVNPYKKIHALSGKPNSKHDTEEGEEDSHFKKVIERANQEPVKKYAFPQTEAQEIGWITQPLIDTDRSDKRINFFRQNTAITKYMDAAWRVKEQTENMN